MQLGRFLGEIKSKARKTEGQNLCKHGVSTGGHIFTSIKSLIEVTWLLSRAASVLQTPIVLFPIATLLFLVVQSLQKFSDNFRSNSPAW